MGRTPEGFGFDLKSLAGQGHKLSIRSDAHPANSWSHSVVLFPSAESIFTTLENEKPGSDVLWVRFSEEDPDFNYEKLSRFTYHNCRTHEAGTERQVCEGTRVPNRRDRGVSELCGQI